MIPFSTFEPDSSKFNPAASVATKNVLPVKDGWAPMRAYGEFSSALSEQCYGAQEGQKSDGTYELFAFTETTIQKYDSSTMGWTDVTPLAGAMTLPNGNIWSTVDYGDYVIGTNTSDGPQYYDMNSSTEFIALPGSPPSARYVNKVGEYLFLMHTTADPNLVQWSGIGDITEWTEGEATSSSQTIPDAGPIQGSARAQNGLYVICQDQINLFTFNPTGPYTFSRSVVNPSRGCISPGSIVEANGTFFYLDEEGFYMGPQGVPIGAEKVNRYFLDNVDADFLPETQGAADAINKIVWWRYKKTDATYEMLGYDWQLDRWTRAEANVNFLFNLHSPGYTLDGLDAVSAVLDDLPYSLDSRVWKGGRPTLAAFNTSHKFGYFEGDNMEASLETADVELGDGLHRACLRGYRFKTDAATFTGQVAALDKYGDTVTFAAAKSPQTSGIIKERKTGRLHRFRQIIPAAENWTHSHGVLVDARQRAGRR